MKSTFEQMGGTYHWEGDYLIPDLTLGEDADYELGKYGRMHRDYLKNHCQSVYTSLFLSGTLFKHLADIDRACNERMETIVAQIKKREGVTEALKARDQMAWVGAMNSIRNRAEEIVLSELVYN